MSAKIRRAFSLVEILIVLVVLGVLAAFLLPHYLGGVKDAAGRHVDSPKQRAKSVDCMNNLQQIHMAVMIQMGEDEANRPKSLFELKGLSPDMLKCPVGGEPYQYDPATGRVWCTHPGHEANTPNGG